MEKLHDVGSRTQNASSASAKPITVPGTSETPLFARRWIQDLGYEIVYVTGGRPVANMSLGVPDIGLTTVTEVSETVAGHLLMWISVPLIVGRRIRVFRQSAQHDSYRASCSMRAGRRRHTAPRIKSSPNAAGHFCRQGHYFHRMKWCRRSRLRVDTRQRWRSPDHRAHRCKGGQRSFPRRSTALTTSSMSGADVTFVEAPENLVRADPDH